MIRALHLADLHPNNGATFAGKTVIDPETGRNLALTDLDRSLEFVAHHTTGNPAVPFDLALIAGDVFDSHKPHPNEIRLMRAFFQHLSDYMPIVMIPGNHDMSQNPMDATALEAIKGLENVHVVERPESRLLTIHGESVQIFCLPYPTKGRLLTQDATMGKSPEEITALVNHGLGAIIRDFVAERIPAAHHVLLAHGSVGNATVGEQPRSLDHDILIPREDFRAFDYVALGHIHQPQALAPNAYYSGSLVRAGFGEEYEDKGFNVVELHPDRRAVVEPITNPHARTYRTIGLDDLPQAAEGLDPQMVWRFRDSLTDDGYQRIKPALDRLAAATPWLQVDIDRIEETRARDAGMTSVLTTDEALLRALAGKVEEPELPELLEKHRAIEQEVG